MTALIPPDAVVDVLDVRGLTCPLPVLRLRKRLQAVAPGTHIKVIASDVGTWTDIPAFCDQVEDAVLLGRRETDDQFVFLIQKTD